MLLCCLRSREFRAVAQEETVGNAGALGEAFYEFSAVLVITVLGSVSTLVFGTVCATWYQDFGLPAEEVDPVGESLRAAMHMAEEAQQSSLATSTAEVFTDSLQFAGIIGGAIMVAVGAAVFLTTPKGTQAAH